LCNFYFDIRLSRFTKIDTSNFFLIQTTDVSELYVWDLNTRTCINRVIDDRSLSCALLAVSPSGQFVIISSAQSIINLYNMKIVEGWKPYTSKDNNESCNTNITSLKYLIRPQRYWVRRRLTNIKLKCCTCHCLSCSQIFQDCKLI